MRKVCRLNGFTLRCEILDVDGQPIPSSATVTALFTTDEAGATAVAGTSGPLTRDASNPRVWTRAFSAADLAGLPTTGTRYLRVAPPGDPRVEPVECVPALPFEGA
jgi:hypothetical protein